MIYNVHEQIAPHFQLWEALHYNSLQGLTPEIYANIKAFANKDLEEVRRLCGNYPMKMFSWFRTEEHNKEVGGAPHSFHLLGRAGDIFIIGQSPKQTQDRLKNWRGGLGCYSEWTHVDNGPKRRWWGP